MNSRFPARRSAVPPPTYAHSGTVLSQDPARSQGVAPFLFINLQTPLQLTPSPSVNCKRPGGWGYHRTPLHARDARIFTQPQSRHTVTAISPSAAGLMSHFSPIPSTVQAVRRKIIRIIGSAYCRVLTSVAASRGAHD